MIKLILNPDTDKITQVFEKESVIIGKGPSDVVDFILPMEALQEIHLKIVDEKGKFTIQNSANDPFVSINGLPFGKKVITHNQTIEIGKHTLLFQTMEEKPPQPPPPSIELADFDDEVESFQEPLREKDLTPKKFLINWRLVLWMIIVSIVVISSIIGGLYLRATGKSSQEEKSIAAGVADIAMAMRYARLQRMAPQVSSWADPDFLRNNISKVLSPKLQTLTEVDAHGRFLRHPYILRILANPTLSRFLIIAQPAPNLFHWVMMKGAIVVDSESMELKKVTDIRALNRLLANPDPLDGKNGEEISRLLISGTPMPLPSLAGGKNNWGFTPPSALGFIRPSAENYIYNAPRYHPFGESMLKRAIHLVTFPSTSDDVAGFRQEVAALSEFPDLVLYSSEGMKTARAAQKNLNDIAPENELMVGSLKFNQAGVIIHTQLLMDDTRKDLALFDLNTFSDPSEKTYIDTNNPLYLRLNALALNRKSALKPIYDEMAVLLSRHTQRVQSNFAEKIQTLLNEYKKVDREQQSKIGKALPKLYQEAQGMPVEQFMQFVEAAELADFADKTLATFAAKLGGDILTQETFEKSLADIQNSSDLEQLHDNLQLTKEQLTLEKLPDHERLNLYQKTLRINALNKIAELVLSESEKPIQDPIETKELLQKIYKLSWVDDPQEMQYFLDEVDVS